MPMTNKPKPMTLRERYDAFPTALGDPIETDTLLRDALDTIDAAVDIVEHMKAFLRDQPDYPTKLLMEANCDKWLDKVRSK